MKKIKRQEHNMRKQKKPPVVTPDTKSEENPGQSRKGKVKPCSLEEESTKQLAVTAKKFKSAAKAKSSAQKKENLEKEQKKQRIKQLRIANKLEDKNIKKIEKQLNSTNENQRIYQSHLLMMVLISFLTFVTLKKGVRL